MQNCSRAILASAILDGPPAFLLAFCVNTRPSMSSVSSTVPPTFLTICESIRGVRSEAGVGVVVSCSLCTNLHAAQQSFHRKQMSAALPGCLASQRWSLSLDR
eukprot:COSAG03_NODE_930_length_5274_cov_21.824348_8_plen_103_part_00